MSQKHILFTESKNTRCLSVVFIYLSFPFRFICTVDWAVKEAHEAIMENHGQNCCAGSRTFVHEDIYDVFVEKASKLAAMRVVGDPFNKDTQQGPLVCSNI